MTDTKSNETTPDQLMKTFEGRSLKSIIIFTVVVHAILLLGTSVPYLFGAVFGKSEAAEESEEVRMTSAVKDVQAAIRDIADQYGLKAQDLSSQFAGGAPKAPESAPPEETPVASEEAPAAEGEEPKSEIEKEIEKVEEGPELPPVEDEDLFK